MGTIKDRNGMDLTKAEDKRRGARIHRRTIQKYLHNSDNHYGLITPQASWNEKSSGP